MHGIVWTSFLLLSAIAWQAETTDTPASPTGPRFTTDGAASQGAAAVSGQSEPAEEPAPIDNAPVDNASAAPSPPAEPVDWVGDYLEDPLAESTNVSLDDIARQLANPAARDTVLQRHWSRLTGATVEQQTEFLRQTLRHESLPVRRQAAEALQQMGMLEQVVGELLLAMAAGDDIELRRAAVVGLELINLGPNELPADYWQALADAMRSADETVRRSAEARLQHEGARSVPLLLELLQNETYARVRQQAAALLSRLVGSRGFQPGALAPESSLPDQPDTRDIPQPEPGEMVTPPKAPATRGEAPHSQRVVEPQSAQKVRVYFGTNRERLPPEPKSARALWQYGLLLFGSLFATRLSWRRREAQDARSRPRRSLLLTGFCLAIAVWSGVRANDALRDYFSLAAGVKFGPRRDHQGQMHLGFCDVSLPPTHDVGVVESALIGPDDEQHHVVLHNTELLEDEEFVRRVRAELDRHAQATRSCFVFVHGFNVTFEQAARRTAQIHFDLEFKGAPLFYSWPSRGSFRHYSSDRNEIDYSRRHLGRFLSLVADRLDAPRIHVVAHSMGADLLSRAIRDLGEKGKVFDQIVLAAPDIDADVFREEVVPRMSECAHRVTLYCSRNDWALQASYAFNDSPRAGDSSRGIFVSTGLDTVDASEIDTDLLGHSYYGDCLPLLRDVQLVLDQNLPPNQRNLRPWFVMEKLAYWTFGQ